MLLALAALPWALGAAAETHSEAGASERAAVRMAGARFEVEVMRTPAERERGLMFRPQLAPDQGMLFVFDPPAPADFWMKNVPFAIDILFIDASNHVRNLHAQVPPCTMRQCPTYASDGPVRYALEVPAGTAANLGVKPGTHIRVELSD